MSYQSLQKNWDEFSSLIESLKDNEEILKNYCLEQSITIINDILLLISKNLESLKNKNTSCEIIYLQTQLINDIHQKLSSIMQRFLTISLSQISDQNDWLKAHCDLATD